MSLIEMIEGRDNSCMRLSDRVFVSHGQDMLGKPFRDRIVEREVELRNAAAMMDTA